jgi:hypothetical protein
MRIMKSRKMRVTCTANCYEHGPINMIYNSRRPQKCLIRGRFMVLEVLISNVDDKILGHAQDTATIVTIWPRHFPNFYIYFP